MRPHRLERCPSFSHCMGSDELQCETPLCDSHNNASWDWYGPVDWCQTSDCHPLPKPTFLQPPSSFLFHSAIKFNGIPFAGTMAYTAFKSLSRFIEACSVARSKPHNSKQTLLDICPPTLTAPAILLSMHDSVRPETHRRGHTRAHGVDVSFLCVALRARSLSHL